MGSPLLNGLGKLFGVGIDNGEPKFPKKGFPKTISDKERAKKKKARKFAKLQRKINRQKRSK
jgi:hypothetical protein